jgi:hypothetical protein
MTLELREDVAEGHLPGLDHFHGALRFLSVQALSALKYSASG